MCLLNRGLTLIELLIVLAIISILTTISYPAYHQHVLKTRRVLAKVALLHLATNLEHYYNAKNTYEGAKLTNLNIPSYVADNYYQLEIVTATSNTFLISAVPVNDQTKDLMCRTLSLDQNGEKFISGAGLLSECW